MGKDNGPTAQGGGTLDAPYAHVWTLRDGKAVHFRAYTDTANVLQSLG